MSEHTSSSGAGRWAERAKAAAERRQSQRPARPEPTPGALGGNPFLPGSGVTPGRLDDADEVDVDGSKGRGGTLAALGLAHVSGPTDPPIAPVPLNPALTVPAAWPSASAATGPQASVVQLVGLHGGAGTSTLAALLGPAAVDCGARLENLATLEVPVLFVCRTHAHGLDLAIRIGQQYAAGSLEPTMVLGICVVHDAPSLSKGLARTLRSVQKTLPNCWTVPWDEDLRHDPALPPVASRGRMARDVRRILGKAGQLRERREPPHQSQTQNN